VDPAHRPTRAEYDRYLYLVQLFRSLGWDNSRLHDASPFKVVDPGFNAILIRSDEDLAALAGDLGLEAIAKAAEVRAAKARAAFATLWSDGAGQFLAYDRVAERLVESPSVGGILPLFAGLGGPERQARIIDTMRGWRAAARFGVPSHDPRDSRFDAKRYWRGPCWLIVNYLIVDGLRRIGRGDAAHEVIADSLELIRESGFAEYYDPIDGEACGGGSFTWTAAMVIEFLAMAEG
jgi:glycogen debranching enzyme